MPPRNETTGHLSREVGDVGEDPLESLERKNTVSNT